MTVLRLFLRAFKCLTSALRECPTGRFSSCPNLYKPQSSVRSKVPKVFKGIQVQDNVVHSVLLQLVGVRKLPEACQLLCAIGTNVKAFGQVEKPHTCLRSLKPDTILKVSWAGDGSGVGPTFTSTFQSCHCILSS